MATLTVERLDAPGRLTADIAYRLDDQHLKLALDVTEPAGGLATQFAGLPDGVDVSLNGAGDLNSWAGQLKASSGAEPLLDLALTLLRQDGDILLTADGPVMPGLVAPPDALPLIGAAAEIGLTVRAAEDGDLILVERATVDAAAFAVTASGSFAPPTGAIEATLASSRLDPTALASFAPGAALTAPEIRMTASGTLDAPFVHLDLGLAEARFEGIAAHGLLLAADLTGPMDAPNSTLALRLDRLASGAVVADAVTVDATVRADRDRPNAVDFEATARAAAVALCQPALDPTLAGPWQVNLKAAYDPSVAQSPIALTGAGGDGLDVAFQGDVTPAGAVRGRAGVTVADLQAFAALAGAPLSGPGSAAANVDFGPGGLALDDIAVTGHGATVSGRAMLDPSFKTISAALKLAAPQLGELAKLANAPISGAVSGDFALSGAVADPAATVALRFKPLVAGGERFAEAALSVNATTLVSGPKGAFKASAQSPYGRVTAESQFALKGDALALKSLKLGAPGAAASGSLNANLRTTTATGKIALNVSSFADALRPLGIEASGKAKGDIVLKTAKKGGQTVDLTVDIKQFAGFGVELAEARLTAKGGLDGKAPIAARLSAKGFAASDISAETLTIRLDGPLRAADLKLTMKGRAAERPLTLNIAGVLAIQEASQSFRLAKGDGAFAGAAFAIARGLEVSQGKKGFAVRGLDLQSEPLSLRADASVASGRIDLDLKQADVDLRRLAQLMPDTPVAGTIFASGRISGPLQGPSGRLTLTARGISALNEPGSPSIDVDGNFNLSPSALALDISGTGLGATPITIQGSVGLVQGDGLPAPGPQSRLALRIQWTGDVAPLMAMAPVDGHILKGATAIDLSIGGTVAAPDVQGAVRLGPGTYESLDYGTKLEFATIEVLANGPNLTLSPFKARAGKGTISGQGTAFLDGARGYPFEIAFTLANARVAARDDIRAEISGDVKVTNDANGMLAYARIVTEKVEIELIDALPPSIPTMNVTETGPIPPGRKAKPEEAAESGPPIALDVTVAIPSQFFVRGRGLDSEWQGNIAVTGTADRPTINGRINLKRGRFDLLGKDLALKEGVVQLQPDASQRLEAVIDILAQFESDDFIASVRLEGPATAPELILSSSPDLPQDEILSRLLFGKSAGALSAVESFQLAAAVASMAAGGGGGGFDPIRVIRQATGLDNLRIDVDGAGAAALEAGKYLTDDIYVGVKQGATAADSAVIVEIDIFKNVTIESESRQDGSQKVGGRLKWDY